MTAGIDISIAICLITLIMSLLVLRSGVLSLGLPFAYLSTLHLNHLPGAFAHWVRPDFFFTTPEVSRGLWITAIGSVAFLVGVLLARLGGRALERRMSRRLSSSRYKVDVRQNLNRRFSLFCLIGGWLFVYGLSSLSSIPTLGALLEKGGAIWMLGALLGLRAAFMRADLVGALSWVAALSVYPVLMLLLGGFLSYGSAAAIIVLSVIAVAARRLPIVLASGVAAAVIGLSIFVNYFIARDALRSVLWSGAGYEQRFDAVTEAFSEIEIIDFSNDAHVDALDQRLNQNYFVGLSAERLDIGLVDFRWGASFYEAAIAVIPRAIWPDKPVFGGSGTIVRDMTGLPLSLNASWGVGQVMEFYINFGWISLIVGFVALGWLIARLDIRAAAASRSGDAHTLFVCFLPCVALIQPIGSLVELVGGAAAAYLAALGWSRLWKYWSAGRRPRGDARAMVPAGAELAGRLGNRTNSIVQPRPR